MRRIGSISVNGSTLVISGSGGSAGGAYVVLKSANVALPMSNWTAIATNQFDGYGNFNFNNAPDPALPQTFYVLKLQ